MTTLEYSIGIVYDFIFKNPLTSGCNKLVALSGFASGSFVQQLLMENQELSIQLIVGLAKVSGISNADHYTYRRLMNELPGRFECKYFTGRNGVHAKAYCWLKNNEPSFGYIGSPNLTWQGMIGYEEVASAVDAKSILQDISKYEDSSMFVTSENIEKSIKIFNASKRNAQEVAIAHGTYNPPIEIEEVTLSLLDSDGNIHNRSGLNWGQRPGREPNQAYIPIQANIHENYPNFFPEHGRRFTIVTDDGKSLVCVIAQAGDKAIECPDNNSILGKYFRERVGLNSGDFFLKDNLESYGRTDVKITKLDSETYLMDFSV